MDSPAKEFVLKHVIRNLQSMDYETTIYGDWEEHFGVKWKLSIWRMSQWFYFSLQAGFNENTEKSVSTEVELRLAPGSRNGHRRNYKNVFDRDRSIGLYVRNEQVYYALQNRNLHVEFHVKILEMTGFEDKVDEISREKILDTVLEDEESREKRKSFGEEVKRCSDYAKSLLSSQSSYFDILFAGLLQESGKNEIETIHLQGFMEVLYEDAQIDDEIVEGVLNIAHIYDTSTVVTSCEEFLLEKSTKSLKEKLRLSGKYKLEGLKKKCMDQIETVDDIRSVTLSNPKEMGPEILAELLQKSLALH